MCPTALAMVMVDCSRRFTAVADQTAGYGIGIVKAEFAITEPDLIADMCHDPTHAVIAGQSSPDQAQKSEVQQYRRQEDTPQPFSVVAKVKVSRLLNSI
jgi:hypothetical protein